MKQFRAIYILLNEGRDHKIWHGSLCFDTLVTHFHKFEEKEANTLRGALSDVGKLTSETFTIAQKKNNNNRSN